MKPLLLAMALATSAIAACDQSSASPPATSTAPAQLPAGMSRVTDASQVCMVNDQFMGKPQIPIAIEGRTYYGCCPMCKERLANQPESRRGTDPVTGKAVDKAAAIMVKDSSGKILYFESEDSLRRYTL